MNRKWIAIAVLLVLILSVCLFAAAEEATDPVYPGQSGTHEHDVQIKIMDRGYTAHRLHEWCPGCGRLLKERLEGHSFEEGVCTVCDWECPHPPEAAVKHTERDGVKPQWDGNYIICPGWEVTECSICGMEVSRVETTVREFHNLHTHFTPVLGCVPYDSSKHALIRFCDECGTEVPEYAAHNCPASDAPYKDDGNLETHVRYVKCDDCGDMIPQRQAHTWVHDKYTEFDGMGDYHNEVMHCTVCGAIKQVPRLHEWKLLSCTSDEGGTTHTSSYECTVCGDCKETEAPHTLEHYVYKNDGDVNGHIEVLECTECGQIVEGKRVSHKPTHLYWKSVSDTQDQETVICNLCGLTYQGAPENHKYDAKSYESDGNAAGQHTVYQTCSKCGARDPNAKTVKENHSLERNTCTKCGQSMAHDGGHSSIQWSPIGWVPIDENQHGGLFRCSRNDYSFCGERFIDYSWHRRHTFDPITMKCTGCGYLKEGCEHHYTYEPDKFKITAEEHTLIGTCTGCGKQINVNEAHTYTYELDKFNTTAEEHAFIGTCTVCGKQVNVTEAHGNAVVKDNYEPCENGHKHTAEYCCPTCGYVLSAQTTIEAHTIASAKSIDEKTHLEECEKCHLIQTAAHNCYYRCNDDYHWCRYCGFQKDHTLRFVGVGKVDENSHPLGYLCDDCYYFKWVYEAHKGKESYAPNSNEIHNIQTRCEVCGILMKQDTGAHEFNENDICKYCGYHRGDPIEYTPSPEAGLPENSGDLTEALPAFCHLTADGKEILYGYAFEPTEDGDAIDLILFPESAPENTDFEVLFPASELELLKVLGVKKIYLHLNGNDILLLNDIEQTLTILSEQETDELLIILTHEVGSDGAYTAVYVPQGNE